MRLLLAFRNIRPYISTEVNTMQCFMSLHQTLQGNKRKTKSPARHREAHRSRQVRLGCEVMEDRVLMSAGLPDYHFTAPALVAGTTQHNAPSSIGAFTKTPGETTQRIVSNGSMQAVAPAAPSFTATAVSGTQINLAWTSVAGATGYEITINGGDYEGNVNLTSNYTSYAVTDLSPNTTYNLDVAAYNAAGTTWANSQSATTLSKPTAPSAPFFMAMAVSATQINLVWTPVAGATGYQVDKLINGVWKQIGSLGSGSTGYAVTGLSPNTTYYFKVGAYNAAGTTWANSQSATTFPALPLASEPFPGDIDYPVADDANGNYYNYTVVNGTLFGPNGPVYTDVHQGLLGDCWLLASFAEAAARAPQDITRMFTDLGTYMENGVQVHVWSVNFYDTTGVSRSVIVDNELPVNSSGNTVFDEVSNGVLWVALAEKAYIQAAALGYVTIDNPADNSYMSINGGYPYYALAAITGHQATDVSIDASGIDDAFSVGDLVVLGTGNTTSSSLIEPNHCYAVINDNPTATWQYTVYNPWGTSTTYVTDDTGNTVYGSTFYCDADFINANWVAQDCATA